MKKVLLFTLLIALSSEFVFASVAAAAGGALAMGSESALPALATCPNPYVVRTGDTLAVIARRCGLTLYTLKRINGLTSTVIRAGQRLYTRSTTAPRARAASPSRSIRILTPVLEPLIRP